MKRQVLELRSEVSYNSCIKLKVFPENDATDCEAEILVGGK